jgi:hypothetical protein
MDAWLAVYDVEGASRLWTLAVDDEVVGAALLVLRTERRGLLRLRCLYLNTAGEGQDSVTLEHNAVLAQRGHEDLVWRELRALLLQQSWDEFILAGGTVQTSERLQKAFPDWKSRAFNLPSPFVSLPEVRQQPEGLLGLVSPNSRSQIRRAIRSTVDGLSLDEAISAESREQAWRELDRLHTLRWRSQGIAGAFSRQRWRAFHERLLASAPGHTRLFTVRAGDETIAAAYLLQFDRHVAFYQSGVHVVDTNSRFKPGILLHAMITNRLAAELVDEYDYLASDEQNVRYKRSLATSERAMCWVTIVRPTLRSRLVEFLRLARALWWRLSR